MIKTVQIIDAKFFRFANQDEYYVKEQEKQCIGSIVEIELNPNTQYDDGDIEYLVTEELEHMYECIVKNVDYRYCLK